MYDIGNNITVEPIYTRLSILHKWFILATITLIIITGEKFKKEVN